MLGGFLPESLTYAYTQVFSVNRIEILMISASSVTSLLESTSTIFTEVANSAPTLNFGRLFETFTNNSSFKHFFSDIILNFVVRFKF